MNDCYIGFDLGGTSMLAIVMDGSGALLSRATADTRRPCSPPLLAEQMAALCLHAVRKQSLSLSSIKAMGAGVPGAVDPLTGEIALSANFGQSPFPLGTLLKEMLPFPVYFENDANAAALGEYWAGAGKGADSLLLVTLGTGIGCGAVINGRLLRGVNNAAGEAGHMVIRKGGRLCGCGRKGCWEAYASATALSDIAHEALEKGNNRSSLLWKLSDGGKIKPDAKSVFDASDHGDELASLLTAQYLDDLACGLINLVNLFQPQLVCVGGGVALRGERLLAPLRARLDQEDYGRNCSIRTRLAMAALGNDAGAVGAAMLAKQTLKHPFP